MDAEKKQLKNLFRKLVDNENSVLFAVDQLTKRVLDKVERWSYDKDRVFYKLFKKLENEEKDSVIEPKVPFYTPFVEQRKDIDRSSALYTVDGPIFSCGFSLFTVFCKIGRRSKVHVTLRRFI